MTKQQTLDEIKTLFLAMQPIIQMVVGEATCRRFGQELENLTAKQADYYLRFLRNLNEPWLEAKEARELVAEETWAFYDMMLVTGLQEQDSWDKASKNFKEYWKNTIGELHDNANIHASKKSTARKRVQSQASGSAQDHSG